MSTVEALVRPPGLQTIRRDYRLDQNQGQVARGVAAAGRDGPRRGVLRGEHRQTAATGPIGVEPSELTYPPAPPKRGARHPVAGATAGMVGQFTGNVPLPKQVGQ
jgi:hypothetical protein